MFPVEGSIPSRCFPTQEAPVKYHDRSFSVSVGGKSYADNWDRIFKGEQSSTPVPATTPPAENLGQRQCAACLERGSIGPMMENGVEVPGLLQCGICLARFPVGVEQAQKVTGPGACINCDGTGRLRTTFTVFACGACGGTGAQKP